MIRYISKGGIVYETRDLHQLVKEQEIIVLEMIFHPANIYFKPNCNVRRDFVLNNSIVWKKVAPLHLAIHENNPRLVEILLEQGADVCIKDGQNKTPIMYIDNNLFKPNRFIGDAVLENTTKILDLLFEYGASEEDFIQAYGKTIFEQYKYIANKALPFVKYI